jgi:acyl-CoA reductase-like NAD-dependent aldehyde dehydrogenase
MNIYDLACLMKAAHKAVGEQWKALSPERRKRICDNIMKRAEKRIKEKNGDAGKR